MRNEREQVSKDKSLGALAREVEQVRVKTIVDQDQSQGALLPQVTEEAAPVSALQKSKTLLDPRKAERVAMVTRTTKLCLVLALLLLCGFGNLLDAGRLTVLANIMSIRGAGNVAQEDTLMSLRDANQACARAGLTNLAEASYKQMAKDLTSAVGADDQRVAYVQLCLAELLLKAGKENEGRQLWREQLKTLDQPQPTAPRDLTSRLLSLAHRYDDMGKKDDARDLYNATIRFWPHAPGYWTLSNCESALADIESNAGHYQIANELYLKALAISGNWGRGDLEYYNFYRLQRIADTYSKLNKFKEALPYAHRAFDAATHQFPEYRGPTQQTLHNVEHKARLQETLQRGQNGLSKPKT